MDIYTADLCDDFIDILQVATPIDFKDYGGRKNFHGEIVTIKCFEKNPLVKQTLNTDGTGKVLVVDGGGSLKCALMGDNLAALAIKNNWNGVLIYGCIRDSREISTMEIGIKALNTTPRKSIKIPEGDINNTVSFADVNFTPGHYIYCDEDGIVVSEKKLV
ncbi:ribonuclease E activity regulator RraA [Tenacibaculum jejuense]|uniref:4-hydroxy-4-methyl-2-oxoglutarate aldolase n=1 Tax=Tenacibaculum jejuense TaxID=584609 RepID=A0A238U7L6_9FLAO|nr:ribonuclease E activity regulator RraA [Tenacibaculum jejuense]SNR14380.1 putative regulator of ribonuclease activity [Tenacibaculum jejuense]